MTRRPLDIPFQAIALGVLCLAATACSESRESGRTAANAAGVDAAAAAPAPAAKPGSDGAQEFPAAPQFSLPNVAGGTLAMSDFAGKVVLIDFWATWCPPCRAGIPHLNELYRSNKAAGFEIVGVSVDRAQGSKTGVDIVREFMARMPIEYPLVVADAGTVQSYGGISSIPTAFLVDRAGRIRKKYVGLQPKEVFVKDIAPLLAEKAPESEGSI